MHLTKKKNLSTQLDIKILTLNKIDKIFALTEFVSGVK